MFKFMITKCLAFAVLVFALWGSSSRSEASSNLTPFVCYISQSGNAQRPLSTKQVEQLIKNETPDAAIAIEIERRGVDFQITDPILKRLELLGAGPKILLALRVIRLHLAIKGSHTPNNEGKEADATNIPPIPSILESDFTDEVLKSTTPVLVFFCTDWDSGCRLMSPTVVEIAETYKGKIRVIRIDVSINENIAQKYKARSYEVPILIFFSGGSEQGRLIGVASKQSITRLIEKPSDFKDAVPQDEETLRSSLPSVLESDFNDEVLKSQIPVLVFFYASFQRAFEPTLLSLVDVDKEYKDRIKVVLVDVRLNQIVAKRYEADFDVGPVLALFKGGIEQGRIVGSASKQSIKRLIENPSDFKLATSRVLPNIVESDFNDEVIKSAIPVLVFFCADYRTACKPTSLVVGEIAETYKDRIKVVKVEADINENIARKYDASSYYTPVLILFDRGKVRDRIIGTVSKSAISRMIDKALIKKSNSNK
jgi:thioredoxin 1